LQDKQQDEEIEDTASNSTEQGGLECLDTLNTVHDVGKEDLVILLHVNLNRILFQVEDVNKNQISQLEEIQNNLELNLPALVLQLCLMIILMIVLIGPTYFINTTQMINYSKPSIPGSWKKSVCFLVNLY
jgi:hypothetical protein